MENKHADRIANALEEMVFTGEFREGQRLDEASLAKQFGVSRTPIREALQRLVASGLARQRPRRGVFVRQPSSITLIEMFETMAEIEAVCGRLATKRMTASGLEQLKALNSVCEASISAEDANAYSRANESFHHLIYKLAGNAFLESEALSLYHRLKPFRRVQLKMRGRMAVSEAEHSKVIAAFSQQNPELAADILREHVGTQGDQFYLQMAQLKRDPDYRIAS
ncbi:MAG: GntR family transcriptional regulator [Roseobacter sp.]|jgi:DNA-binding GntR family transcriptional regulator